MGGHISTAVYIDGYNLYYGRLRGTAYKWLDVVALFRVLLHQQQPEAVLNRVKYFSAPALGRFATHGAKSTESQSSYHRALQVMYPDTLLITLGSHTFDRDGTLLPKFELGKAYDRNDRVRVWKIEEKQTDVNLALAMYRDACSGLFKQLIVCSNDSDVAPVLSAIKSDFPAIRLGVVTPRRPPIEGKRPHRAVSSSLDLHSDWTRQYLLDAELEAAQLPDRVATGKKPIRKPEYW
jgi:uncharacterized LabA/DUF88 family protein